jgi:molybdopterin synthase sulfur carrier subunit
MPIKVLLFAQLAELMNAREIYIDQAATTDELIEQLQLKYPTFKDSVYLVAVGKNIIQTNTPLDDQSTVALLPPYSGG